MADIKYWDEELNKQVQSIQQLISNAERQDNMQKASTLDRAAKELREATETKKSYKMEMRLVEDPNQKQMYQNKLKHLSEDLARCANDIKAMKPSDAAMNDIPRSARSVRSVRPNSKWQSTLPHKPPRSEGDDNNDNINAMINAATAEYANNEDMKQFFNGVDSIKSDIFVVTSATEQISTLIDKALLAISETEEVQISDTFQTLVTNTNNRAKTCKNLLGQLKEENSNLKSEQKAKPTDLSVRENLVNTLLRKFANEMKRYQNAQERYKTEFKKKVTRQVQMIKPDVTDQEVDEIMRNGGSREALYHQQILSGGVNDQKIKTQDGGCQIS